MGGGTWTRSAFSVYNCAMKKSTDTLGYVTSGQEWKAYRIDEALDPKNVIRECVNTEEHPNTIPVILALDVTGSMGDACMKTANSLGVIMEDLYKNYKDIEFMIMGIGDVEFDSAPVQASQFESDIRIAQQLDKLYMEHGGGGNAYESYTAAWQFGLKQCKLDCWKQGRKGIIITMGDEPLNPYLKIHGLNEACGKQGQTDIDTDELYEKVKEKYDVYHIAVNDSANAYSHYKERIRQTFERVIGDHLKISTLQKLPMTINACIADSINKSGQKSNETKLNENGEVTW